MLPSGTLGGLQSALVRGLYGYDADQIWWERPHAILYRGRRRVDGLPVLIKLLRDPGLADWGAGWFQRDYDFAQSLSAGGAVKPLALEQTDRGPALIFADDGARPLEEAATKGPLDIDVALKIGVSLAEAVAALHKERLTHCNLNLATVWLNNKTGVTLISDFGCARRLSDDTSPAFPCDDLLDVRYISPEQTGRLQSSVDQRSDIYSLGIILFRLLTGKVPFDDADPLHVIDGHLTRVPTFPAELSNKLPTTLTKVILKALAKGPEARYMSAGGLLTDLVECRAQWLSTGTINDFEPGRFDAKAQLRVSRQLYGREHETAVLLEKARSVRHGSRALLLVKGAPGAGKSTLIAQLEEFARKDGGRFVLGKFDQYKRNVPYLALIQALQQLIGQLLGGSKDELEVWRRRILGALGNNAQVVIDVIPEVELVTGRQPPVPALPPTQARNRFNRVFTKLIQTFAARDRVLCIVMDDLQWVDTASLALLAHVLTDSETKNVLFAGAYRDNEVSPTHPLETAISELKGSGTDIQVLDLNELKESDLLRLVRDTFAASADEAHGLAQVLYRKSGGNPLFLTQFLPYLCDENLIAFDYRSGKWAWDLVGIQQQGVTQDVLDLLHKRLGTLQQDTRMILATAACVGSSFEADKVAVAAGRPLSEVLRSATAAVREGLIIALVDRSAAHGSDPNSEQPTIQYRFLHDRIQQAAFDCIPTDAKKEFRLSIGRRLMAALGPDDELIPQPDVLSNLNSASDFLVEEERQPVARLNLVAGRRARQALAYQDALGYISVGLSLLGKNGWQTDYELAFELHSEALECEYLSANFERADGLFHALIANAKSKSEMGKTYRTKIILDTSEERHEQAIKIGIEALKLFGVRYVRNPSRLHLLLELLLARLRLKGRQPQDLINAKGLDNPEQLVVLRVLTALFPTAYFLSPDLLVFTGLKVVNYSLRYGISPLSALGFAVYGLALGAGMDDHERGYDFGRFAIELAEKGGDVSVTCKVQYAFAAAIKPWRDPIDESFPLLDAARKLALDAGDHQYATYCVGSTMWAHLGRGTNLDEFLREYDEQRTFVDSSRDPFPIEMLTIARNYALALQGKTSAPYSLCEGAYDETRSELHYRHIGNLMLVFFQNVARLQLACLFGRFEDALALSEKGEAVVRFASGITQVADHYLYRGLAASAAIARPGAQTAAKWHRRTLRHCLSRLRLYAANSPHNFRPLQALLEAEAAQADGHFTDALKHYNCTIETAEAEGFTHLVGLASERAAILCLANEQRLPAAWYLACSRAAFDKWGARAKVAWLDREYRTLLLAVSSPPGAVAPIPAIPPTTHQAESFDIAAALQAARIIASGENVDRVLTHLMQVIRVQAGAEVAHLLVLEGGKLRLEASATIDTGAVVLFPDSAQTGQGLFSQAIINYVLHTGEDLIVNEPNSDPRFAQCSYVANHRPKSALCSPIRYQGELLGVIYLEHTQIADAFFGQKLEWLRLLATEVGLTVWSARLSRYRDYVHKFAPPAVAKEIDANPASPNLEAKDCDVSILFGDLAGYTRMAEQMERRQLDALISRIFARFIDEIHRYEGTLLEIRGDELFVLFDDRDRFTHARKALHAALAISRAAAGLKDELSGAHPPIILNMGINSGTASVGMKAVEAASGSRWRYGASGTVVNVAARVRELARDGNILISAETASRTSNDFELEDKGEHALKNVKNSIRIYRLLGERGRLQSNRLH